MRAPALSATPVRAARENEALRASIGRNAKAARLRLGLSQADVAASVGLAMEVYGRLERGLMAPSVGTLWRLCVALGMSADAAFGLESSGAPAAALAPARPQGAGMRRLVRRASALSPRAVHVLALVAATMKPSARKNRARKSAGRSIAPRV
jgi:transcriptional regulator with XRE-family HTH domain